MHLTKKQQGDRNLPGGLVKAVKEFKVPKSGRITIILEKWPMITKQNQNRLKTWENNEYHVVNYDKKILKSK